MEGGVASSGAGSKAGWAAVVVAAARLLPRLGRVCRLWQLGLLLVVRLARRIRRVAAVLAGQQEVRHVGVPPERGQPRVAHELLDAAAHAGRRRLDHVLAELDAAALVRGPLVDQQDAAARVDLHRRRVDRREEVLQHRRHQLLLLHVGIKAREHEQRRRLPHAGTGALRPAQRRLDVRDKRIRVDLERERRAARRAHQPQVARRLSGGDDEEEGDLELARHVHKVAQLVALRPPQRTRRVGRHHLLHVGHERLERRADLPLAKDEALGRLLPLGVILLRLLLRLLLHTTSSLLLCHLAVLLGWTSAGRGARTASPNFRVEPSGRSVSLFKFPFAFSFFVLR